MSFKNIVLNRKRVTDQIKDALKRAILKGEFNPGDKFPPEDQIAAQFKVSKVSVREALRDLETEGFIEKRRGIFGGNFVMRPGIQKMDDLVSNYYQFGTVTPEELVEFRQILEPALVGLAAIRRTNEDLKKMKSNIQEMEKLVQSGKIVPSKILEFHRIAAEACHNQLSSAVLRALVNVSARILSDDDVTLEDAKSHVGYSKKFYECIVRKDREGAQRQMALHFKTFVKIIQRIKEKAAGNKPEQFARPLTAK